MKWKEKLQKIQKRYFELQSLIANPDIISNLKEYQKYVQEFSQKEPIVKKFLEYKKIEKEIKETEELLSLKEMRQLAKKELELLKVKKEKLEVEFNKLLFSDNPLSGKNIIMEIRAGTGGQESALFVSDLFRMYTRFAERKLWKIEVLDSHPTDLKGFKEIIFSIEGNDVYRYLQFEKGVHRVQRIPVTESGGRIHTSTVTVAVLPEAKDIEVNINPNDLRIDTFSSSGKGGQHLNRTYSAVRITHIPTGIVVQCQDERSQLKNKNKAMKILRARILAKKQEEEEKKLKDTRRTQIGSGQRSEKIRTYNFPQDRVTDHRVNLTLHNIRDILDGNLDQLVEKLLLFFTKQ